MNAVNGVDKRQGEILPMAGKTAGGVRGARVVSNGAVAIALIFAASGVARAQPLFTYFSISPGTAPIILSAPHGGTLSYPFPERSCTGNQVCILDANTRQLAQATSNEFFALTGLRPYVVIALGDRKYIDFNRSPDEAYDSPDAARFYDFYHDAIDSFMQDIRDEYGRGLMLDIHGQSAIPDQVLRGTKNGLSVSEMLGVWGEAALNGPNSILGALDAQGITAHPSIDLPFSEQVENPSYDGGHITTSNGSHHPDGIDTIQLEFGFDYRGGAAWQDTSASLAAAMQAYLNAYLQEPILPGDYNADGVVDAADYTSWRDAVGSPAGSLPNGVNGGAIGSAHYETWSAHYGPAQTLGASVPEASTLAVAICATVSGWLAANGRRR